MQELLHLVAKTGCFFHPQTGAAAQVQPYQAGVNRWKKILSQEEHPDQRQQAERKKKAGEQPAMLDRSFQQLVVAAAELVETPFKSALKSSHERLRAGRLMLVSSHDVHHEGGDERSRKEIRGQHGEDHGLGERHEEKFRHARQEKQGHEHDADANRGDEGGYGDLRRAIENRLLHLFALGKVALDVFDFHGGVIHKDPNCQRQTAQGHDVNRLPERTEHEDGYEDRKRDRDGDDNGGTPVTEEKQDHRCGQGGGGQCFQDHAPNGGADEQRLIEERADLHLRRERLRCKLSHALHTLDDGDGGSAADLQHRHQGAAGAVHAHDIGLRGEAVADVGHIAHIDGRSIHGLDRKFVQFRDGLGIAIHLDLIFQRTYLCGAGRKNQVLRVERIHDVIGRKAVGLKSRQVEVYLNLAYFAAVGVRRRRTGHRCQLRAQKVLTEIEKLLLRQCLAAQAKLDNRGRGGRVADDQRRRGSGRQAAEDGLYHRRGLRQRGLDIRRGLEKNLDDPDTV